jgi:hypothetical protein
MNEVRAGAGYGVGRPVQADWLDQLQKRVVDSLPSGWGYVPAIQPSIAFISSKDISETEGTRLFGMRQEEADAVLDEAISRLYGKRVCGLLQGDLGLAIVRYRIQSGDHGTVLRLNTYDSFARNGASGFWRIESEKIALRRELGFDGSISRKIDNKPKYWLNLGNFTASSTNGDLQGLKNAITPSLPRSPRFTAVTTFQY